MSPYIPPTHIEVDGVVYPVQREGGRIALFILGAWRSQDVIAVKNDEELRELARAFVKLFDRCTDRTG